jgi:hypothetical protein
MNKIEDKAEMDLNGDGRIGEYGRNYKKRLV